MVERPSNNLSPPPLLPYSSTSVKPSSPKQESPSKDTLHSHQPLPDMASLLDEIVYLKAVIEQADHPTSRLLKPEISREAAIEQLQRYQEYLKQLAHWSQACQSQIDKALHSSPSLLKKLIHFLTR